MENSKQRISRNAESKRLADTRTTGARHSITRKQLDVPDSFIEDTLQVSLRQGRALQVLVGPNLLRNDQCLVIRNWLHALLSQALKCSGILSQVKLCANEDNGDGWGMVIDLREPLFSN